MGELRRAMDKQAEVAKAEKVIQGVLRDLETTVQQAIDMVRVDTRNFANYGVEIFLKQPRQQ